MQLEVEICSFQVYHSFLERHSKYGFANMSGIDSQEKSDFLQSMNVYSVDGHTNLSSLGQQIWASEHLEDSTDESMVYKSDGGSQVRRQFYCYAFGQNPIPLTKTIAELQYANRLILVYREEIVQNAPGGTVTPTVLDESGSTNCKSYLDVVTPELPETTPTGLKAVFIPVAESDRDLSRSLRHHYQTLVHHTAYNSVPLHILEKPNTTWDKSFLEDWNSRLKGVIHIGTYQLFGFSNSVPYSQGELQKILPDSINPKDLPGLLIYENLLDGHVLLSIPDISMRIYLEAAFYSLTHAHLRIENLPIETKSERFSRFKKKCLSQFEHFQQKKFYNSIFR